MANMTSLRIARTVMQMDCNSLAKRLVGPHHLTGLIVRSRSFKSNNNDTEIEEEIDLNKPIKYSTSEASKLKVETHRGRMSERPPFERTIIGISVLVFMLYFCVLREENDIDNIIGMSLPERLAQTEQQYKAKYGGS